MRIRTLACASFAILLAWETSPRLLAQDARAAEVLAKTRQALGGARLDGLKALSLEASTSRNMADRQMTGDVEMLLEMPDKYLKSEVSRGMMNMTMNTGFNGDKAILPAGATTMGGGMMVFRMGPGGPVAGDAPKLTDEQKAEMNTAAVRSARAELSRFMLGWFGKAHPSLGATYTYAGEAESPDGKAHVIDVRSADGFAARLFVDQNNHLPLMVTYKARAPRVVTMGGPRGAAHQPAAGSAEPAAEPPLVEFSLFFDDWKEVDGITFPHVMRRGSGGETNEEWTIGKVKVNPKIDAKKFAVTETK